MTIEENGIVPSSAEQRLPQLPGTSPIEVVSRLGKLAIVQGHPEVAVPTVTYDLATRMFRESIFLDAFGTTDKFYDLGKRTLTGKVGVPPIGAERLSVAEYKKKLKLLRKQALVQKGDEPIELDDTERMDLAAYIGLDMRMTRRLIERIEALLLSLQYQRTREHMQAIDSLINEQLRKFNAPLFGGAHGAVDKVYDLFSQFVDGLMDHSRLLAVFRDLTGREYAESLESALDYSDEELEIKAKYLEV